MRDRSAVDPFSLSGALRRIRRKADLSQRELADHLGVSQSTVARAEAGRGDWTVGVLVQAAHLAGLRLTLMDRAGDAVEAMSGTGARDRAGRRLPAHLDTRHGDERWWHDAHRRSRRRPEWTFDLDRSARDAARASGGEPADHHRPGPGDSLAERAGVRAADALRRVEERRLEGWAELRRRIAEGWIDPSEFSCSCPSGCDELLLGEGEPAAPQVRRDAPVHVADCACSCDLS